MRFGSVTNGALSEGPRGSPSSLNFCRNGVTGSFFRRPGPVFWVTRAVPAAVLVTVDSTFTRPPAEIEALLWTVVFAVADAQLKAKAAPKPDCVLYEKMASPVASASAFDVMFVA